MKTNAYPPKSDVRKNRKKMFYFVDEKETGS